jgi:hypothetical protein
MNPQETSKAIEGGRDHASRVLKRRAVALQLRATALEQHPARLDFASVAEESAAVAATQPELSRSVGVLIAEGDSWFDYPFYDVLKILEDRYGYNVESVAHKGDPIEEMAYGGGQLEDFTRRIEKLLGQGTVPKAILLSGGGNDIAGKEFGMLLNHAASAAAGLNDLIVQGVIDVRARLSYLHILAAVTKVCIEKTGHSIPILVHGYDYPVPDGRGFLGGWWFLPGPWLEPGFREKGFDALSVRIALSGALIDRFNEMLSSIVSLPDFAHVRYLDLRNTLSHGNDYKDWWDNELHPNADGFARVTERFVAQLITLP